MSVYFLFSYNDLVFLLEFLWKICWYLFTVWIQSSGGSEVNNDGTVLFSESEKLRREKFAAILQLQQEKGGLIELKKHEVLRPGIYLPQPAALPSTASTTEGSEQQDRDPAAKSRTNPSGSTNKQSTSRARNSGTKKHQGHNSRKQVPHNSRKQVTQWVKKENSDTTWYEIFIFFKKRKLKGTKPLVIFVIYRPAYMINSDISGSQGSWQIDTSYCLLRRECRD